MNYAWMIRQDGKEFECNHHFYCMNDDDLSSEAECSAFIIKTKSKDIDLANQVIDAWLALGIEQEVDYDADAHDINEAILNFVNSLPYRFQYPISAREILDIHIKDNNYSDVDSLYEYCDEVRENLSSIQEEIKHSINQQFCRARYGGQYNSTYRNNTMWFRISSVGFNWADIVYIFTSKNRNKLQIDKVTICRDNESDNGYDSNEPEYFYKAKDGSVYYDMPVDEYLNEEHEHSLVFSASMLPSTVLIYAVSFAGGATERQIVYSAKHRRNQYNYDTWDKLKTIEKKINCISASEFLDKAPTRTRNRVQKIQDDILNTYPEIKSVDVDFKHRENTRGKNVGVEYIFIISSDDPRIDGIKVGVAFNKPETSPDLIFRRFRMEYEEFKGFKNIE